MQAILSNPIQVLQKQATSYWPRIFLNGAVTMFLDEDQVNLIKVMLALVLPVVLVYAKVKVSEISTVLPTIANAISTGNLCNQSCCS